MLGCLAIAWAIAQNVTIINHYGDTTGLKPDARFLLDHSDHHTLVVNYYTPAADEDAQRLEQLVSGAIRLYLDEMTVVDREQVRFRKKLRTVLKEMDDIVKDAVRYYHFKELHDFAGFSDAVAVEIKELSALDLSRFNGMADYRMATRETMKRAWLSQHIDEAMVRINREVGLFSGDNLLTVGRQLQGSLGQEEAARLLEEIENFQTHDPLEPLSLDLSESSVSLMASKDEFFLPKMDAGKDDEPQPEFAERVLQLLESNTTALNALREDVDDIKTGQSSPGDKALQTQIDDLRNLVMQLMGSPVEGSASEHLGIANLPKDVSIHYDSGETEVNSAGAFILGELVDLMARNPEMRVMVTGYADKRGNPETNARISGKRAALVRDELVGRGIAGNRLILNHFGDLKSTGENPEDRKVVITFLPR